jgi:hypothetical protein
MADVFVSYRISDSAAHAGRLADSLKRRWGAKSVFLAADDLEQGKRWRQELLSRLKGCRVVLVIIGPIWSTVTNADGASRLGLEDDIVRMEIREALRLHRPVVPVLVGGANLPESADLPHDLRPLLDRSRAELRNDHWEADVAALADAVLLMVPAIRVKEVGRELATVRGSLLIALSLLTTITAGHIALVRFDVLDAYTLRTLPYVWVLVAALLILVHNALKQSFR